LRPRWRGALLAAALTAAPAAGSTAMAAAPAPAGKPVVDPHYGDALFFFFQERYFTSVTNLMVSQHFERMPSHADDAEVLRGGLLLSYGLHREAGQIFERLAETTTAPAVRDRAWFYLAKIRYQRGLVDEAKAALDRIGDALPKNFAEERALLHANVLMALGDYAGASALLSTLKLPQASPYVRFNLGVAQVRSGNAAGGSALLDELGRSPTPVGGNPDEFRTLRDRANVALGFAALQDERPADARLALERVRLEGLHSNKALLGFGWAAAAMKNPKQALVPWTELAGRDPSDAAVLEARIAVPYALAELGAYGQALARYNEALDAFGQERVRLDESIGAIRAGKLLDGLAERNPGEEMGWFWTLRELPEMPHASHLTAVLAGHAFQEAFKNYRDLLFLEKNLAEWQDRLGSFDDMLANRQQAFAERLPKVRQQSQQSGLGAVQQRRDALAAELDKAIESGDGLAFATERERDLAERIQRSRDTLARIGADPSIADSAERLRRAQGALAWHLAREVPGRTWDARKALRDADATLTEAKGHEQALLQAEKSEPAKFAVFSDRIKALRSRLVALAPRVNMLAQEQRRAAQEIAVAELGGQKERLVGYETQARFAVAQIQDRALQARSASEEADRAKR
jgi:tetratricopeptide (TPR) repeat protein